MNLDERKPTSKINGAEFMQGVGTECGHAVQLTKMPE